MKSTGASISITDTSVTPSLTTRRILSGDRTKVISIILTIGSNPMTCNDLKLSAFSTAGVALSNKGNSSTRRETCVREQENHRR